MVVIAEGTRRLLGNLFELQDLGAKDLKGIAGPARALAALREVRRRAASRRCTRASSPRWSGARRKPICCFRRWAKAKAGEGQVVLLSGEAGIGKSRLTAALLGTPRRRAAHAAALFLLAAAHRQRVLPDHRPDGARRRTGARRCAASEARQARCGARADLDLDRGRRAVRRNAVAAERWPLSRARSDPAAAPAENAGGARFTDWSAGAPKSGADDLRGCALDRPHQPGSVRSDGGPDRGPSRAADRDVPAGVRSRPGSDGRT